MRKSRFLNAVLALGLVTGLFAGAFAGTALASPEAPGQNAIFFPFVYNGTAVGGQTMDGSITVQNIEDSQVDITVWDAAGNSLKTKTLNPRASITYTAAALGLKDGGQGVVVTAQWTSLADRTDIGLCAATTTQFTRTITPPLNTVDETDTQDVGETVLGIASVSQTAVQNTTNINDPSQPANVNASFNKTTDYTASFNGSTITIDWSPDGHEPDQGEAYNVTYYTDCGVPRIAGVEKHSDAAGANTSLDGYSAVPLEDLADASDQGASYPELDLEQQTRWILPIVQTNNGWNSIVRITNVSDQDASVNAYFYASGTGITSTPIGIPVGTIAAGDTVSIDLTAAGISADMVGALWIDSDVATVALVDRYKDATTMDLTNVAQPRTDDVSFGVLGSGEARLRYGSLVMGGANDWNTGLNIANLSSVDNNVTITFYDNQGQANTQPTTVNIPARGMKYVYRPNFASLGFDPAQPITAIIRGSAPIAAVVDEVKYTGSGSDVGQAMSYAAQQAVPASVAIDLTTPNNPIHYGKYFYMSALSLPLYQQGMTAEGPNSGMNMFNPSDASVWAMVQILDSSGIGAPGFVTNADAEMPSPMLLSPFQSTNVYAPFLTQLPSGSYSAVVGVVSKSIVHALLGNGALVGVSNNVDYSVGGDGSAVFNMTPTVYGIGDAIGFANALNRFQIANAGYCGFIPQNLAQQLQFSDGPCLYANQNQVPNQP